jgi:hypothetical protein
LVLPRKKKTTEQREEEK